VLEQGQREPVAQDHVQRGFEYLQGGRLHNLPGQPVPVLCQPHGEDEMDPPVFQVVPTASGAVTGYH